MSGFVLLVRDRRDDDAAMRVGFTVTKKIGNAVVRNRMKRRLRALARELLPDDGVRGADHVLIGRAGGVERDFSSLRSEFSKALAKVKGAVRPELVEGRSPSSFGRGKNKWRASTGSGRTGGGSVAS
jgi:ribonuclease P protein component